MEPIVNQAAKLRYMFGGKASVPMVIRAQEGAGRGNAAQHSQSLEAWFCHIPGLKVVTPSTPADAKGLLKTAIRDDNPVIFLEHKVLYFTKGEVPEGDVHCPVRRGRRQARGHATSPSSASTRWSARRSRRPRRWPRRASSVEVIDPRTLVPLDERDDHRIGQEDWPTDRRARGVHARRVRRRDHHPRGRGARSTTWTRRRCGSARANVPVPYSAVLETAALPQVDDLIAAARALVNKER